MHTRIRVVVVEDNDVFREALVLLLGGHSELDIVGAVGGGEEAVALCRAEHPDVVLMDYRLPGMDGVQATVAIRRASPGTTVVSLTASATLREAQALRDAGAALSLTKDAPLDEIVAAVREAALATAPRPQS